MVYLRLGGFLPAQGVDVIGAFLAFLYDCGVLLIEPTPASDWLTILLIISESPGRVDDVL